MLRDCGLELIRNFRGGLWSTMARDHARDWMWSEATETLVERVRADAHTNRDVDALEADVVAGRISPAAAARRLLGP